ncbi:MAG: metallophosphoesterase family protein, partial [Verrucomicrobiota bacterium]
ERMAHGHEAHTLDSAVYSACYDYVLTGHTHVLEDRTERKTRVINPGAVYRAAENTVAVLDLETDVCQFLKLNFDGGNG